MPEILHVSRLLPVGWRGHKTFRRVQVPVIASRLIHIIRQRDCKAILAVFPDEAFLLASYIAARVTGCAFYPYLHNTFVENRFGYAHAFAQWLQTRVFELAEHVFVMSEALVAMYARNYPGLSCSALPHGFCEPLDTVPTQVPTGTRFAVGFCGSVNASCQDAAERAIGTMARIPDAHFRVYSGLSPKVFFHLGCPHERSEIRCATRPQLLAGLRECDIVFLPHGFEGSRAQIEYDTIFPTKTIEYLICGRPILAHTPPGSFLTRFLKQHDCALVVEEKSPSRILAACHRLRTDAAFRAHLVRNALKAAEQFRARTVAESLRRHMLGCTRRPDRSHWDV